MTNLILDDNKDLFDVRHRFYCVSDGRKGPWRDTAREALIDAKQHREEMDGMHEIEIVTQQKMTVSFQ